jgi:hypothetical protein
LFFICTKHVLFCHVSVLPSCISNFIQNQLTRFPQLCIHSSSGGLSTFDQSKGASLAAVTTLLSASSGSLTAWLIGIMHDKKIHLPNACNGLLAGLVAITGPCAYVEPWAAIIIGILAGVVAMLTIYAMSYKLHIDDPLDAFAIHGMCGALGVISTGLFAIDGGLFMSGTIDLLLIQLVGLAVIIGWSGVTCAIVFLLLRYTIGITVDEDDQILGLDLVYGSGFAYPGFDPTSVQEFNRQKQMKPRVMKVDRDRLSFTDSESRSATWFDEGSPYFNHRRSKQLASEEKTSRHIRSDTANTTGSERKIQMRRSSKTNQVAAPGHALSMADVLQERDEVGDGDSLKDVVNPLYRFSK